MILDKRSKIIGQGITGSEGSVATAWIQKYGTKVLAGVTPGKGGQVSNDIPIFNSVAEVVQKFGSIDASYLYVPPLFVKKAAFEALDAGIKLLLIVTEKVPVKDSSLIYAKAEEKKAKVIGPSSVGLICPRLNLKLGSIGGATPERVFVPGNIAVVSKSGGMTSEIGLLLKNAGLGISWAVGIGGDRIIGTDFADFLIEMEKDEETRSSVVFGELGGTYEERLADMVKKGIIKKPVTAFIGGEFTQKLPSQVQFGHAGAIIEGDRGKPDYKRKVLKEAGVKVANDFDEIVELVKDSING